MGGCGVKLRGIMGAVAVIEFIVGAGFFAIENYLACCACFLVVLIIIGCEIVRILLRDEP